MWIDSHCHLDAPEFDADGAEVIARARAAGVGLLVIPSVTPATFATARDAAQQCNGVYALGIHPLYVDEVPEEAEDAAIEAQESCPTSVITVE